jgi:DNA-binding PadR family transcriptional regulator
MSGYDVKRLLKSLNWLIGSPSFGSLYPSLHALLEDGLATVDIVHSESKPPRKVYSITEAGRQALQEWMDQPMEPGASLKAFLMRLMLASNLSHTRLVAYLQQRRSQVALYRADLERVTSAQDETAGLGQRLAFDYGLAAARTELAWLDRTLRRMGQQPLPIEILQGDSTTPTA